MSEEIGKSPLDQQESRDGFKELKHKKEFGISSWAINNKMTVFVITGIIILSGLMAYVTMAKESFPEIIIPQIFVSTPYPGNSPEDIETLITRPLEKELNSITGVDVIKSTSSQGFSVIDVKFDFKVSPADALRKVKDKVDIVKADPDFPDDLPAEPNVFEMNFSELIPVMNVNLSGDFSLEELEDYAELLEDRIEDLPQISKVDIKGVMDKEVRIELDPFAMEARQVGAVDIEGAIAQANMTISGGDLKVDNVNSSVRVVGEFTSVEEIGDVMVKSENQNNIYLREIATISFVEKDKESYAREYLNPVVSLDIIKRAGENLIQASAGINAIWKPPERMIFQIILRSL